eukprot:Skav229388  [mRNA]  locus=scaffold4358:69441:69707:+ [translate_table: standard]
MKVDPTEIRVKHGAGATYTKHMCFCQDIFQSASACGQAQDHGLSPVFILESIFRFCNSWAIPKAICLADCPRQSKNTTLGLNMPSMYP